MVGYKHPCVYCDKLVPSDARNCPFCGKANPKGPLRCPQCMSPIEKDWIACAHCGLRLQVICPQCGKGTFLGDRCTHCNAPLTVVCPNKKCKQLQPPGDVCIKCGKPLK